MNRTILGKVSSVLFVFYLIGFAACFVYSITSFPQAQVLLVLQWKYIWTSSLLLFLDYLIPIHASGIVVAFSLFFSMKDLLKSRGTSERFSNFVSSTLILIISLTILFTVLVEVFRPPVLNRRGEMEYMSQLARQFLNEAKKSEERKDYASALSSLELYLTIDKENRKINDEASTIKLMALGQKGAKSASSKEPAGTVDADVPALMEKARYYRDREDYSSAYYYANLASRLDPTSKDARDLARAAIAKVTGYSPTKAETEAIDLLKRKREAFDAFSRKDFVAAYYQFKDLSSEAPRDTEISGYLEKSREAVASIAFFLDEAEKVLPLPGTANLLFVNENSREAKGVIFIEKMVTFAGQSYFLGIEVIKYRPTGEIIYQLKSPYGKLIGNQITLDGINRDDHRLRSLPVYLEGSRPREERSLISLKPPVDLLQNLSIDRSRIETMGIADLWTLRENYRSYGFLEQSLTLEIVTRLLLPFVFLVFSLFSISFGWAYRGRYLGKPPFFAFLFIPVLALVVTLFVLLYIYAQRILLGFTVLAFGFAGSLIVLGALQLVLVIIALITLAGQSTA